jgi:hypothetical protein
MKKKNIVHNFLAAIKIAWRVDATVWQRVVLSPAFWERVSKQLEAATNWTKHDEALVDLIVQQFEKETAHLPLEMKVQKLELLLREGWANAKAQATLQHKLTGLIDQINKKLKLDNSA